MADLSDSGLGERDVEKLAEKILARLKAALVVSPAPRSEPRSHLRMPPAPTLREAFDAGEVAEGTGSPEGFDAWLAEWSPAPTEGPDDA